MGLAEGKALDTEGVGDKGDDDGEEDAEMEDGEDTVQLDRSGVLLLMFLAEWMVVMASPSKFLNTFLVRTKGDMAFRVPSITMSDGDEAVFLCCCCCWRWSW